MRTDSPGSKEKEQDRRRSVSVAVSFGHRERLVALGSGVATLTCPECGAQGERWGNPGEEVRFHGFVPLTEGGTLAILCRCEQCNEEVTLSNVS